MEDLLLLKLKQKPDDCPITKKISLNESGTMAVLLSLRALSRMSNYNWGKYGIRDALQ